jgi:uncharacterized protein YjbJ (UPF0337 family)
MSITSDIRAYADTAVSQGKQVLDSTISGAQAQLNDVSGQANDFVGKLTGTAKENVSGLTAKAGDTVTDLRVQAEKAVNLDAIKAAVEPYLAQAKGYTHTVTDRAEALLNSVKSDKRVAKLVSTAESFTGAVVGTVQQKLVKPVQSLTGIGGKPAVTPSAAAPKPATAPAVKAETKPAPRKTAARKSPAGTSPARKSPARKAAPKAPKA